MISTFPSVILPILAIAGFSWLFVKKFDVSPYIAPICAIGSIVTILYLSDFLLLMRVAAVGLLVCGTFLLAYYLIVHYKTSHTSQRHLVLLAVLVSGLIGLYDLNYGAAFTNWDEFSHWGTFTKLLDSEHTFHLKQRHIRYYFEDYPPGTAIFSYFFLRATGYSESVIYFAHSVILVAACLPVIGLALTVSYLRGFFALVACYLLIVILGQGWSSALIDQIVGVLFGGIICSYWMLRDSSPRRIFVLIPALCFLVLSKQSGSSFVLLIAALIVVDQIWASRNEGTIFSKARFLVYIAPLWIIPRLIQTSWTWHVNSQELTKTFSATSLSKELVKLAKCCHTDRELVTTANFFQAITGRVEAYRSASGNFLSLVSEQIFSLEVINSLWGAGIKAHGNILLYFCVLLAISIFFNRKNLRGRLTVFSVTIVVFALAYSLILLVYYLYVFSEYEGRSIASHVRFLNTYGLGMGLFTSAVFFSIPAVTFTKKASINVLSAALLLHVALGHPQVSSYLVNGAERITPARASIRQLVQPILANTPKTSNVFLLWQSSNINENGPEFWMMHYEVRPRNTNSQCFSLGKPQYVGDIWSCNMNEQEVRNALGGYHHVVVGSGLQSLRTQYPQIFALAPPDRKSGIFEAIKDENGKLALRPFDPD